MSESPADVKIAKPVHTSLTLSVQHEPLPGEGIMARTATRSRDIQAQLGARVDAPGQRIAHAGAIFAAACPVRPIA